MSTLYENFIAGTLSSTLTVGGTTVNADCLANVPVVTSPDFMWLVLDPEAEAGDPEVVKITAHSASATSATIVRAQQDTTAREHLSGRKIAHAWTEADITAIYDLINGHIGEGGSAHAAATTSVAGFLSAADKTKLDGIEAGAKADQLFGAGAGIQIDTVGPGDYEIAHYDTSTQSSVNNSGGTVIQDVTLDGFGHVTALGSKSLSAADVGAASSSHTHDDRYYTESQMQGMFGRVFGKRGTTQSIGNSTWTSITLPTEVDDDWGGFTPGQANITLPANGLYIVVAHLAFETNTTGVRGIRLGVTGDVNEGSFTRDVVVDAASQETNLAITTTVRTGGSAGTVNVQGFQNSGGALSANDIELEVVSLMRGVL